MRYVAVLRAFVVFILISVCAFAQRDLGTITGTITDPQGAGIPNARVTITEDATGLSYTVQTTQLGEYVRPLLKPGTYTITVEVQGFRKAEQKGVIVTPGDRIAANITLQVGQIDQTVEVMAAAPLLQTESTVQGANLNTSEVSELPLGGQRTFTYLARLSPGVVPAESGARDATGGGFSANGVRSTGENNFLLNGVDNNVNVIDFINQTSFVIGPSVEAIGEMQILTNGYNAEYGRAAGGVVNVNLKSGTNQIHGALFEFLQNTDLDANRWENNFAGVERPPVKQNQFGGAAGGPIIKNKLFIFGDYQGTRIKTSGGVIQNLGYGQFETIPTQAMVGGDFSALLGKAIGTDPVTGQTILQNEIFNPASTICNSAGCTRAPFPNNKIPSSLIDPAAAKIASLYPATNQPFANGNFPQNDYYALTAGSLNTDQGDGRVDYRIDEKDSLFGSISWSNTNKGSVPPFQGALDGANFYGVSEQDLGRNAQLGFTRIWTPTIISETRVGFSRLVTARTQANASTDEFKAVGIGGYDPTSTLNGGLPQIGLGRYSQVGANDWLPTKEYSNVWDFIQNVSINKGAHAMKFGAEFRPIQFPFFQVPFPHGEMNFARTETAFPSNLKSSGLNGTLSADTGDEFASFLLGAIDNGQISTTNFISSTRKAYAFYGQDDWKVTPKITLELGIRYELWSPIGEQFSRQSNFDINNLTLYIPKGPNQNAPLPPNFNQPYTFGGITYPALFPNVQVSRGQVSQYLIPWDKADVGPRIGIAWNVLDKTVIRAAYGIFYGGEEQQGGNPNRGESAPFNESPQLNRPPGVSSFQPDPFFANGAAIGGISIGYPLTVFTTTPASSLQFREVANDFRNPMVQKWNFAIQRELPGQMALEVGYQGNHSSHQLLQPDFNTCPNFATTNPNINCNSLRLYPDIGSISGTASFGYGNYEALTAKLEKRLSRGLQFIASYTYGHALANSGTTLSGSNGLYTKDPANFASSYASASWDIRHNFTTGFTYQIPFGRGMTYGSNMNRVVDFVVGGWQANGILTLHTGQPYTLRANGCQGIFGGCSPDAVSGMNPNGAPSGGRSPNEWFNIAAVTAPGPLSEGNLGLQTNYGPPTRTLDFSLFKDFRFTERFVMQFRAESFNLANTPQFSVPDNTLGDANFGKVTSTFAGSERHIQFALRLQF
ncbi:MAG TPA: TonB-dependent receptor [Bryobacteraceae bacterium]|nr:TonB-dependent receptor [Bryobacteraceae bacterium]